MPATPSRALSSSLWCHQVGWSLAHFAYLSLFHSFLWTTFLHLVPQRLTETPYERHVCLTFVFLGTFQLSDRCVSYTLQSPIHSNCHLIISKLLFPSRYHWASHRLYLSHASTQLDQLGLLISGDLHYLPRLLNSYGDWRNSFLSLQSYQCFLVSWCLSSLNDWHPSYLRVR